MNPLLNEIASRITGHRDLESCSMQELEQLATKYPAFSTAHLLAAARSLQKDPNPDAPVVQKAKLLFHNVLWSNIAWESSAARQIISSPVPETITEAIAPPAETGLKAELETPFTHEEVVEQLNEEDRVTSLAETTEEPAEEEHEEYSQPGGMPQQAVQALQTAATAYQSADEKAAMSNTLTFEPYHTVDYFASQGIRYRDELRERDKFSIQLRSFTEWLKTLKRLPESEAIPAASISEEKKVVQMAEVSIAPREVVTETMAEVWEKQGNYEKAIHIYEKLSLLDPAKSAYFAAKIEQLKHS